jgi:HEPN domain-containing protein
LQALSRVRAKEAKALLDLDLYDGAYYLAGYAVECALKACIAKGTRRFEFPDKKRVDSSYTHDLELLMRLANLYEWHRERIKGDPEFKANWGTVEAWDEQSRYERHSREKARQLLDAVFNRRPGVLAWVRLYW